MALNLSNNNNLQQGQQQSGTQPTTTQNQVSGYNNNSSTPPSSPSSSPSSSSPSSSSNSTSGVSNQQNQTSGNSQAPKAQGSGFTNVQDYYGANQNNNLSGAVSSGVQNTSNQANTGLQQSQNQYQQGYNTAQGYQQTGQNLYNNLNPYAQSSAWSNDPNAANNAIQSANTTQNQQAVTALGQGYSGPTGLNNANQLSAQASALQQLAQGLNTSGGRQAALQQFVGQGQYTQGQQGLDSLLLGQNANSLNQARTNALQTAANVGNTINKDTANANALAAMYGTTANQVGGLLNTGLSQGMQGYLANKATGLNTANNQTLADITNALGGASSTNGVNSQTISSDDINQLIKAFGTSEGGPGITGTYNLSGNNIYGNLAANNQFQAADVASQNELASRNALSGLTSGKANTGFQFLNGATGTKVDAAGNDITNAFTSGSLNNFQTNVVGKELANVNNAENNANLYDIAQGKNVGYQQYQNDLNKIQLDQSSLQGINNIRSSHGTYLDPNSLSQNTKDLLTNTNVSPDYGGGYLGSVLAPGTTVAFNPGTGNHGGIDVGGKIAVNDIGLKDILSSIASGETQSKNLAGSLGLSNDLGTLLANKGIVPTFTPQ